MKIVHITSSHPRYDIRIFHKECRSLADKGYDVTLLAADGEKDEVRDGVRIRAVNRYRNWFERLYLTPTRLFKNAIREDADIYHLHDPELLYFAYKLARKGKRVVIDLHEDTPKSILQRRWLTKFLRRAVAYVIKKLEDAASRNAAGVICVLPYVADRLARFNQNIIILNNFPILEEFKTEPQEKNNQISYTGIITRERGIKNIVQAMSDVEGVQFNLAGEFKDKRLHKELKKTDGWSRTNYLGYLERDQMSKVLSSSIAGILLFLPYSFQKSALPNKLFEYMAAKIPVICSDFPHWKKIIDENKCGLTVDPNNVREISEAMNYIRNNKDEAMKMGEDGRKAVEQKYNWKNEKEKLLSLYKDIYSKE